MWRYYKIEGQEFYAPNLDIAFCLARAAMPWKTQWTLEESRA